MNGNGYQNVPYVFQQCVPQQGYYAWPINPMLSFQSLPAFWQWLNSNAYYNSKNPADALINFISANNAAYYADAEENSDGVINGIKYIKKASDTLSEGLSKEQSSWDQRCCLSDLVGGDLGIIPSIINAPTGYGKTMFVIKTLRKMAYKQGYYVLLVVNRSVLKEQIARLISKDLSGYTVGSSDNPLSVYGNLVLCTYQYFMKDLGSIKWDFDNLPPIERCEAKNKLNHCPIKNIGYIVMDEMHYFISDSTFGGATHEVLRNILHLSYSRFDDLLLRKLNNAAEPFCSIPNVKRIYMTATPDYVRDIILYEESCAREIRRGLLNTYLPNPRISASDKAFFNNERNVLHDYIEEFDFPAKESKSNINPIFYFN